MFGNSVFVYKILSVIRNLSNFWLSLRQRLPTHITIETAQELSHFTHNTWIQMGIQAVPVALLRSLWTRSVWAAVVSGSCHLCPHPLSLHDTVSPAFGLRWSSRTWGAPGESAPTTRSHSWEKTLEQPWSFFIFFTSGYLGDLFN